MQSKGTNPTISLQTKTARRVPLHGLGLSLAILLLLATAHTARAQQVVGVYFEDLGYGSAMSYVFAVNSATNALIGTRTTFYPQGPGVTTSFAWGQSGNVLTLAFAATVDLIEMTGYDASIDVLYFTRWPGYWAGCQSPYIPAGIPYEIANQLCSFVSGQ